MKIEGKRRLWQDYQKEVAEDKFFYVRSCIRQTFFPGSERAFVKILSTELGKEINEDPAHTSCTGIGYHTDIVPFETTQTVVARQFSLMTEAGSGKLCSIMYYIFRALHRDIGDLGTLIRIDGRTDS